MGVGQITIHLTSYSSLSFEELKDKRNWLNGVSFSVEYVDLFNDFFRIKPVVGDFLESSGNRVESVYWNENRTSVALYIINDKIRSVHIRINLQSFRDEMLKLLCDFAVSVDSVFVIIDDHKFVEPDEAKLREAIASSRATMLLQYI